MFALTLSISSTGEPDREPVRPQVSITQHVTAYYAFQAIMAGVLSRDATGKGVFIDVSTFDSQVGISILAIYIITDRCRVGLAMRTRCHLGGIYQCWPRIYKGRNFTPDVSVKAIREELKIGGKSTHTPRFRHRMVPYQMFATKDGFLTIGTGNDTQVRLVSRISTYRFVMNRRTVWPAGKCHGSTRFAKRSSLPYEFASQRKSRYGYSHSQRHSRFTNNETLDRSIHRKGVSVRQPRLSTVPPSPTPGPRISGICSY
jgi:crotonobetainyl-CoA:carnitine CoA-transferase CaiB-like acyl-CoA transferase